MRKKLLVIIFLLGLSVALLGNPSPSQAATIIVDGNCTLVDAIIAANTDTPSGNCPAGSGDDTILLTLDFSYISAYPGSTEIGGGQSALPDVTSNIFLLADGHTILGGFGGFRLVYTAQSGTLAIDSLTVQNFTIDPQDGDAKGGAFYNDGGLALQDSHILNNRAIAAEGPMSPSAIGAYGGAIYSNGSFISERSTYGNNSATVNVGTTSDIAGEAHGGAVYDTGVFYSLIWHSLFNSNNARITNHDLGLTYVATGGAVVTNGYMQIYGNTFVFNDVQGVESGEGNAGALFIGGTGTVDNNTFVDNVARRKNSSDLPGNGGAIYVDTTQPVTINHQTFGDNNVVGGLGEAIYVAQGNPTINGSIIASDNADADCFGIMSGINNLRLGSDSSCSGISSGTILPGVHYEPFLLNNGGPTPTFALINGSGNPAIDGNPGCGLAVDQREYNRDANCDIGAFEIGGIPPTATSTFEPSATSTTVLNPSDTPTMTPTFTASNTATDTLTPSITPTFTATDTPTDTLTPSVTPTFTATDTPTSTWTPSSTATFTPSITPTLTPTLDNGAIVVDGNCTLVEAIIAANTDSPYMGCPAGSGADTIMLDVNESLTIPYIDKEGDTLLPVITSIITIQARNGNTIDGNHEGRLFYIDLVASLTLIGLDLTHGRVASDAPRGGVVLNYGTLNVRNTVIHNNDIHTPTSSVGGAKGGAIYNGGVTILTDSVLHTSFAVASNISAMGGAVYNDGQLTVTRTVFDDNRAIAELSASSMGGAIYNVNGSSISILDSVFSGNMVKGVTLGRGAGIYGACVNGTISGTLFHGNRFNFHIGPREGAGLYIGECPGSYMLNIVNSTFSDNRAAWYGSAMAVYGNVVANYVTVFENKGAFINSIVGDSSFTITNSIIGSREAIAGCSTGISGHNNLTLATDPSCDYLSRGTFLPDIDIDLDLLDNGGHTATHALLMSTSNPAINAIPGCVLSTDQRGFARDGACDIGAFEVQSPYVPLITTADCQHPDLVINVSSGDGPFRVSASGGGNVPVTVGTGTHTILGPDKWDDLTVTELGGDGEEVNLGQFKCRPLEIPVPLTPPHRSRTTNTSPTFSWTSIPDASRYRVFLFDNKVVADRTVDMRQNSVGNATSLVFNDPLPFGRLFWRVRGRVNRVWGYWSVRFTLFVDPPAAQELGHSTSEPIPVTVPTVGPPNSRLQSTPPTTPTLIQPPNSR